MLIHMLFIFTRKAMHLATKLAMRPIQEETFTIRISHQPCVR